MKKYIILVLLVWGGELDVQLIKDLDFLIGDWKVKEMFFFGMDKFYIEKGICICVYYLDDSFIRCEFFMVFFKMGK